MNYPIDGAVNHYRKVSTQSDVATASPHRLVQMLFEGALEKINNAKGFMQRGDIAQKGAHISWAISIIDGLRMSLDKENGGEIAENLDALYEYMGNRLAQANLDNNVEMLDEVAKRILEIKSAWDAIPNTVEDEQRPVASSDL